MENWKDSDMREGHLSYFFQWCELQSSCHMHGKAPTTIFKQTSRNKQAKIFWSKLMLNKRLGQNLPVLWLAIIASNSHKQRLGLNIYLFWKLFLSSSIKISARCRFCCFLWTVLRNQNSNFHSADVSRSSGDSELSKLDWIWDTLQNGILVEHYHCMLLQPTDIVQTVVQSNIVQTVVHFAHFQVQARKGGVWGGVGGCFVYIHTYPRKGFN